MDDLLRVDQNLESAVDRIHQERIFHDLGVDAIAMLPRLGHDIREHHRLAGLDLN
jgi:hypothetical protein